MRRDVQREEQKGRLQTFWGSILISYKFHGVRSMEEGRYEVRSKSKINHFTSVIPNPPKKDKAHKERLDGYSYN